LISHLLVDDKTDLVLDMEAGVEHLSRGTIKTVDSLLIVVEPGLRSVETAFRVKDMATDLGLTRILAIGNKIRGETDVDFLRQAMKGIELVGFLPYENRIRENEIAKRSVASAGEQVTATIQNVVRLIEKRTAERS